MRDLREGRRAAAAAATSAARAAAAAAATATALFAVLAAARPAFALPGAATSFAIGSGESVAGVLLGSVPAARAALLVELADLSTCTTTPLSVDCDGLVEPGDRVVVTDRFIAWLDLTPGALDITNGGAGMLRGLWSIYCCDGTGEYNFVYIEGAENWAPNELLPGSDGAGFMGSGLSLQLRLVNNVDMPDVRSMGAENAPVTLIDDGALVCDDGLFQGEGVLFRTTGHLAHFEMDAGTLAASGFDSVEDANETPGVVGRLRFTITTRFHPTELRIRQELLLEVVDADVTNVASFVMSACGLGNQPWSAVHNGADTTRMRNAGVSPPGCSGPATYAAGAIVSLNTGVVASGGLDYLESNVQGSPGYAWFLTASPAIAGRTFSLTLPAGYDLPDHVQALLNGYSAPGTGVVCLDLQYTDDNQCGVDAAWPLGFVHSSAVDYYTDATLPATGAWPDLTPGPPPPACPAGTDGGAAGTDAAAPGTDAGAPGLDASEPGGDGGPDAAADGGPDPVRRDPCGCGCAIAGRRAARGSVTGAAFVFAIALAALRAARRRVSRIRAV